MKISDHYLGYSEKTLIVVTNNELAKIYGADGKDVEEIDMLELDIDNPEESSTGTPNSAPPDIDQIKRNERQGLYEDLSKKLIKWLGKGYTQIVLCAPEAHKNQITEAMHADVIKAIDEVVPKNLASLELDQVIRILQEKRPTT